MTVDAGRVERAMVLEGSNGVEDAGIVTVSLMMLVDVIEVSAAEICAKQSSKNSLIDDESFNHQGIVPHL